MPHQVSFSAKYALANIQSLSSLLWRFTALLVHAVSVVKSLSWSYNVSVPASMVLKVYAKCMFGFLRIRNENLVSCFNAKCVPKGNEGLWQKWDSGNNEVLPSGSLPFDDLTNFGGGDSH